MKMPILFLVGALVAVSLNTFGKSADSVLLGPDDRITVRCLNADEFPQTPMRIDGDGGVTLPFIGRITLAGLSIPEAEEKIASNLSRYIRNPEVSVNIVESNSQPVSVLGAVNKPGSYQLEGVKTLSELIGMAGGLRSDAGHVLRISRNKEFGSLPLPGVAEDPSGGFYMADIDADDVIQSRRPALNIAAKPYDVISILQADIVYVVGQVRKPGGFTVNSHEGMSILEALSLAEGLDHTAAPKKARIIRQDKATGRQDIPVDLEAILSGKTEDIQLRGSDVLFVPNNTSKSVAARTAEAMIQAATGIVIYGRY